MDPQHAATATSSGIVLTESRMYNYAIPQADFDAEASCTVDGTCGVFFLKGWVPEPYGAAGRAPSAGTITPLQGIVSPGVQPGDSSGGILGEQYRSYGSMDP